MLVGSLIGGRWTSDVLMSAAFWCVMLFNDLYRVKREEEDDGSGSLIDVNR